MRDNEGRSSRGTTGYKQCGVVLSLCACCRVMTAEAMHGEWGKREWAATQSAARSKMGLLCPRRGRDGWAARPECIDASSSIHFASFLAAGGLKKKSYAKPNPWKNGRAGGERELSTCRPRALTLVPRSNLDHPRLILQSKGSASPRLSSWLPCHHQPPHEEI